MRRKTRALLLNPMGLRHLRIRSLVVALATLACVAQPTPAQEPGKVGVSLQINRPYEQPFMLARIEFDEVSSDSPRAGTKPRTIRRGRLPGGLSVAHH